VPDPSYRTPRRTRTLVRVPGPEGWLGDSAHGFDPCCFGWWWWWSPDLVPVRSLLVEVCLLEPGKVPQTAEEERTW